MKSHHEIHESRETGRGMASPSSRSDAAMVAVDFNPRDQTREMDGVAERRLNLPSAPGFPDPRFMRRSATRLVVGTGPWIEIHGYPRSVAPRRSNWLFLSCVSCLAWFLLLAFSAFAQPVTVLDRIGTNSVSTDDNPGGLIAHYAHDTATELWGTCGTVWTQSFAGTLAEVACVGFARVVNATNGMWLDPVTDLSAFTVSLHLWTNGAAGFLAGTNAAHGDIVLPLGPGPSSPALWGVTRVTNSVVNSTNLYISTLLTFRFATNLSAQGVRLAAGREYVLAWAFEGASGNVVVRHSLASTTGAPDVFASFAATRGLQRGYSTNAFSKPQFATSVSVLPDAPVARLGLARREAVLELSWPDMTEPPELWTTTNVADGPWWLWPEPLTTNFLTVTNAGGHQYFRLKMPAP